MTFEVLGDMFEGDFADMCGKTIMFVLMDERPGQALRAGSLTVYFSVVSQLFLAVNPHFWSEIL